MALSLMTALLFSIVSGGISQFNPTQNTHAQISSAATTTGCQQLPIAGVTASGNDGNLPANVLDNNLNTRWSNLGIGSWIQADLGSNMNICSIDIAWYLGNTRQNNFVISVSNDGTTFTNVFTGKSSGTTLSFETYILPGGTTGRYVRVTVNGNTVNNWASIAELRVDGIPQNNPPTANDESIQTNSGTPVTITLTGTDPIPGDVLKFSVVANPQHGTLTNPTANTVTYTPNSGFSGTDSFTYKATDGQGVDSNIATVTITVNAPPPTANDESIQTNSGTPVQITLTGTDPIPGDVLKFSVVSNPQHGTVTPGTVSSIVFYTPDTGFSGTDSFTYKATDGQGVDSNIATVSIIVSSASSGTLDQFGIKELYASKAGGEQWAMNMQNPTSDPRLSPGITLTKNPDGSYKVTSTQVRMNVFTSSGYHQGSITTYNQQQLAAKGYMQSPNDWKNVEMTGYLKVNSFTSSTTNGAAHIELLARGGTHTSSVPCEGTAYHSNTYETGRAKFEKELEHTAGYTTNDPEKSGATGTLQGKWIGIKAVFYTFANGSVQLEQWLDDKSDNINSLGNNWHRVLQIKDVGSWGGGSPNCGGTPSTIITWGGPIAHFRWDNIDNMDIKDLSVREIQPPS
jgi:F5/8 type C domain/Bacterial Ig domain